MALTQDSATVQVKSASAPIQVIDVQVDFDNNYPTGGEPLSALAALTGKTAFAVFAHAALTSGRTLVVDAVNQKLIVLDNAGAEVADTTDISAMANVLLTFLAY